MKSEQHSPQIALWLKLIRAEGIGPTLFKRLLDYFEDVEHIFTASVAELMKVEGIGNRTAESIARTRHLRKRWASGLFICTTSGTLRH
ncbi:MAG: helix-hairpin-helix domain-containing protein [Planctomycetota bacterium]|jgi:ERCC4-type nuclease